MPSSASIGAERQLVVEEGGPAVVERAPRRRRSRSPALHLPVGVARGAQPLDAADLEVGEVVGVVDVALGVDLGVADPEFGLVEYGSGLELGLALLDEGAHAFAGVLGGEEEGELVGLVLQAAHEVDVLGPVRGRLRVPHGEGAVGGDLRGQLSGRVQRLAPADDPVDEAILRASSASMRRPVKISSFASAGPMRRGSRWVPPRPGRMPRPTSGKPKSAFSAAMRMSQASATSQPPAEGEAVHGGDRRDGAPVQQGHRRVPDLREPLRLHGVHLAHRPNVGPRDKRPLAGARHDDRPRPLGLELQERLPDLLYHLPVQGVQLLLTVDGQDRDVVLTLYPHVIQDVLRF